MIELQNISKKYDEKEIFNNINLKFENKINLLVGESGSGKSTLLNLIYGIDQEFQGDIILNGKTIKHINNKEMSKLRKMTIQYIYQDFKLREDLTVYDNLYFSCFLNDKDKKVNEVAEKLKIKNLLNEKVENISGGQKQRTAFARAIINEPKIILMDEPTANLDNENVDNIKDIIQSLSTSDICLLIASHDERLKDVADNIFSIQDKNIIEERKNEEENLIEDINIMKEENLKEENLKYLFKNVKSRKSKIIKTSIIQLFIFIILLIVTSLGVYLLNDMYQNFFNTLPSTGIVIEANPKKNYMEPISRFNFKESDIENVKELENVKNVYTYTEGLSRIVDYAGNELQLYIEKDELNDNIKNKSSISTAPDIISFKFNSIMEPYDVIKNYNPNKIEISEGDFPNEPLEILIPDILAVNYNIEVGQNITLNVISSSGEINDKEYSVSGIYKTNYKNKIDTEYSIYLQYSMNEYTENDILELYPDFISLNESDPQYKDLVSSEEIFVESFGTGNRSMYIEINDAKYNQSVTNELNSIFPEYDIISQTTIQEKYSSVIRNSIIIYIIFLIILITIISFILHTFNKITFEQELKKIALDYSLGYTSRSIKQRYFIEIVITHLILVIISYLLIFLVFNVSESTSIVGKVLLNSFDIKVLLLFYIVSMIILVLSYSSLLIRIKEKNLKKYLK